MRSGEVWLINLDPTIGAVFQKFTCLKITTKHENR